jgi:hypothetical protein
MEYPSGDVKLCPKVLEAQALEPNHKRLEYIRDWVHWQRTDTDAVLDRARVATAKRYYNKPKVEVGGKATKRFLEKIRDLKMFH